MRPSVSSALLGARNSILSLHSKACILFETMMGRVTTESEHPIGQSKHAISDLAVTRLPSFRFYFRCRHGRRAREPG